MSNTGTALQVASSSRIERSQPFSFAPTNFREAIDLADRLAQSELVPKGFRGKPQDILVAMQMGAEVNLSIMQSLKSIAVINGMPSLYGDGFLAVIMSHPAFEWIKEDNLEDIAKNRRATCTIKRRGAEPHTVTFTLEMAQKAGLIGKAGPWTQYEPRQFQMRARGFCGRDTFADALRGIVLADEAYDMNPVDVAPEQPKIQATIVVPTEKALSTPAAGPQPAQEQVNAVQEEKPSTITIPEAKDFYKAYSASGWLPEESKAWLKATYDITDSRLIKPEDYKACMDWAHTPKNQQEENPDSEPQQEWTGELPQE
jgi:hypothetical protein